MMKNFQLNILINLSATYSNAPLLLLYAEVTDFGIINYQVDYPLARTDIHGLVMPGKLIGTQYLRESFIMIMKSRSACSRP